MKKILLAAVAALAIVGCTQNEEIENVGNKAEINFGTIVKAGTRVAVTSNTNFKEFTVSGYKTVGDMSTTPQLAVGFMDNLLVKKSESGNTWGYTGTFYWPITGKVQFFATSPAQPLIIETPGYPSFPYQIKVAASQEDLVAANLINQTKIDNAIVLAFQHLLTQVNFSIKGDTPDFTYTVTALKLKGINDKATFKFDGTNTIGSWSELAASAADLAYTYSGSVVVAPTTGDAGKTTKFETDNNALFMLMPQTLSGATLEITYTAVLTADSSVKTFDGTKTVNLTGEWGMGKNIRYTLELTSDASPVKFGEPTVGGWTDEDGTTTPAK